jgi:hypothetical protein
MTRDDARQIQKLADSISKLNMPSDAAGKEARDTLATMAQTSSLILPECPDKINADAVRKSWRIDGDPPIVEKPAAPAAPAVAAKKA